MDMQGSVTASQDEALRTFYAILQGTLEENMPASHIDLWQEWGKKRSDERKKLTQLRQQLRERIPHGFLPPTLRLERYEFTPVNNVGLQKKRSVNFWIRYMTINQGQEELKIHLILETFSTLKDAWEVTRVCFLPTERQKRFFEDFPLDYEIGGM